MPTTPNHSLPLLTEGQDNAEATVNTGQRQADALMALEVQSDALSAPPGGETDGQAWIISGTATGAWAGFAAGSLALYLNGAWTNKTPTGGQTAFVKNQKAWYGYSSQESAWHPLQRIWSTSEYWTGEYGSGGTKLYCKCFDLGALPNNTTTTDAHGITSIDLDSHIATELAFSNSSQAYAGEAAFVTGGVILELWIDATNINLKDNYNLSSYNGLLRLCYERTA